MPEGLLFLTLVIPWGLILGGVYQLWKMRRRRIEDRRDLATVWRAVHRAHVRGGLPRLSYCRVCECIWVHEKER
jgi:hypothetical protein